MINKTRRADLLDKMHDKYDTEIRAKFSELCAANPAVPAWQNWEDAVRAVANTPGAASAIAELDAIPLFPL
jgi:hypothetical protein